MKQPGVQLQILQDSQFAIQRKSLGHVAHPAAGLDVLGVYFLTEQQRLAFTGRLQTGEHLHGRRFATAIGAEKAENLAALDAKIHVIDSDEIPETTGQAMGFNGHCCGVFGFAWRNHQRLVTAAFFFREQGDERLLQIFTVRTLQQFSRRSGVQHLARVHCDQPVKALGFVHIRRGNQHAHARPITTNPGNQLPELIARQGIDAGGGFIEYEQVRVVNQRTTQAEFLLHASRQLARRAIGKPVQASAAHQIVDTAFALRFVLAEQPPEKIQVLEHGQGRVQILAQTLRHIGDARANLAPVRRAGHIAAQHPQGALLQLARTGNQRQQAGFSHPVRADHPHHAVSGNLQRNVIQRDLLAIAQTDSGKLHDIEPRHRHCGTLI